MSDTAEPFDDPFSWEVQPAAARWVEQLVDNFSERNPAIGQLGTLLATQTGTRLVDWIDHLALADRAIEPKLVGVGYMAESSPGDEGQVWRHSQGLFPPVLLDAGRVGLAIRVDSVDDCLGALPAALELSDISAIDKQGTPGGQRRQAIVAHADDVSLWVTERHGYQGFAPTANADGKIEAAARHLDQFRGRQRDFDAPEEGFAHASRLIAEASHRLGTGWACDLFFTAEREYWQSRNAAARVQYERQNCLGLGWANHDHHTYRSSRRAFGHLIAALEQLGFYCRERFYAGQEAGWGAQVLEHPDARLVVFADVDLSPEEVAGDFAHEPLPERDELGTVGLWCELHGEAFLAAGMHHLECQFDFDAASAQLATAGVESLAPFTDFAFLKQAFTCGETWPVEERRIERLLAAGQITADEADRFRRDGAIGSHLEILERNEGYKGFNQTGVSDIIKRTDPRQMAGK